MFSNENELGIGYDLLAGDIMRGRDNGLQPYYKYVELFGKPKVVRNWSDLQGLIQRKVSEVVPFIATIKYYFSATPPEH